MILGHIFRWKFVSKRSSGVGCRASIATVDSRPDAETGGAVVLGERWNHLAGEQKGDGTDAHLAVERVCVIAIVPVGSHGFGHAINVIGGVSVAVIRVCGDEVGKFGARPERPEANVVRRVEEDADSNHVDVWATVRTAAADDAKNPVSFRGGWCHRSVWFSD